LISGNALAAKGVKPEIEVIGVEVARFPSMTQALAGKPIQCGGSTIAEGIAVKQPGRLTVPIIRDWVDDILVVDEADIEEAVLLLLEVEKTVAEGAGAAGMAAVLQAPKRFEGRKTGLILSGGNIDLLVLSSIIQRGLVCSRRMVRLLVEIRDVPGSLGRVAELIGQAEANIIEVRHQRAFTNLPLQSAEVEFILQTRGGGHLDQIVRALTEAGYSARLPDEPWIQGRDVSSS
jgi:threonine dehydratase